jgi:hypothetical protein
MAGSNLPSSISVIPPADDGAAVSASAGRSMMGPSPGEADEDLTTPVLSAPLFGARGFKSFSKLSESA